jgi:hypothetical protein
MVFGFFILILITLFNYVKTISTGGVRFPKLTGVKATVDSDVQLLYDYKETRFDIIVNIKPVREDYIPREIKAILNTLDTHGYTDMAQQSLPEYIKKMTLPAYDPKGKDAKGKTLITIREPFVKQGDALKISKRVLATGYDDIMEVISNNPTLVGHLNDIDKKNQTTTSRRNRGKSTNDYKAENTKLQNQIDNQTKQIANLKAQPTRPTNDMPRGRRVRAVIEDHPTDEQWGVIPSFKQPSVPVAEIGRRRVRAVIEDQQPLDNLDLELKMRPTFPTISNGIKEPHNRPTTS